MYVVTVRFAVRQESLDAFLPLMLENARYSLANEPACKQFDVSQAPDNPEIIFLYEVYDGIDAFQTHLRAPHFLSFDKATQAMVSRKEVTTYQLLD